MSLGVLNGFKNVTWTMPDVLVINPIGKLQLEYEISHKENKQPISALKQCIKSLGRLNR